MQITVELTEEQARRLHELAEFHGIDPERLFQSAVRGLFSDRNERFERAAEYVLNKNAELLDRLSR
jgi:antitoxin FitA